MLQEQKNERGSLSDNSTLIKESFRLLMFAQGRDEDDDDEQRGFSLLIS
jgi:hypothetical protein